MVEALIGILVNILILLFIYVAAYIVYYAVYVFFSAKMNRFIRRQKYYKDKATNNIVLIVYARNDEATIVPLLESLNKQDYPREHYQIHIILDNCTDNSANILEFIGGAKIWRVGDNAPVGKDESVSWLLERLLSFQNIHGFAFLNANRYVDENFMTAVNAGINQESIIVGSTDYIVRIKSLPNMIKATYNEYTNRIFNSARSLMGLATIVDSDCFIIRQEVLEKLKCVDFKDLNSEFKYTTLLVRNGFTPTYMPTVRTFTSIDNYKSRKPSISFKLNLCWHCLRLLFKSNLKFGEFILSSLAPNFWMLFLIYTSVFIVSFNYYFFFDYIFVFLMGIILLLAFIISLFTSKLKKNQIPYLLAYPFYSLSKILLHIPVVSNVVGLLHKEKNTDDVKDMTTVDVHVTDGMKDLPCKLDLISESGLVKAVFRFKKKRYSSNSHIRMVDAIKDISDKLYNHGFRIKICQSCGYFNLNLDGSTNMVKGFCNRMVVQGTSYEPMDTVLWNSCENFLPQEVNKIIDINTFRDDNQ